jgi:hypothetical protein
MYPFINNTPLQYPLPIIHYQLSIFPYHCTFSPAIVHLPGIWLPSKSL